ncbi:MAG: biotin/lipoyl-binding protein [Bdellovibrionales bacterium]|nr:biotin/lipoyl-binding protein [Bdellovibrionales bacterium]
MKWIEVEFQGRRLRVPAVKSQGKLWVHWQGETFAFDVGGGSRRAGSDKGKSHPGVIAAPMPGKITRVGVKNGDRVSKGQALVVMEAMKMEYTLEADREGQVTEVNVQTGMQVGLGEVLVRVGEA